MKLKVNSYVLPQLRDTSDATKQVVTQLGETINHIAYKWFTTSIRNRDEIQ